MPQSLHDLSQPDSTLPEAVQYRCGTPDDGAATHAVLMDALRDQLWRAGMWEKGHTPTASERESSFARWQPLLEFLTSASDQFWVAERAGKVIGYARSIVRDNVRELTEFFVASDVQSSGVGRELLARAMPPGARRNYIMATTDLRAQALYHRLGLYQICSVYTFERPDTPHPFEPNSVELARDLTITPIEPAHIPMLAKLDQATHGHRRDADHEWLMKNRGGFLLLRDQHAVGYGYVGIPYSGPFALLDAADYPAALNHAEQVAEAQGYDTLGFDVPMLNRTAIRYFLIRGYRMSPFTCYYMCDQQPVHVDKTIITSPMIMI